MTYGEFKEKDADCDQCPILDAGICVGGYTSNGRGEPIEPPCCLLNDEDDLDAWVDAELENIHRREAYEDAQYKLQKEKEAKNKAAREKRYKSAQVVWSETYEIKQLRKKIKSNLAFMRFSRSLSSAFSFADACMSGQVLDASASAPKSKHPLELENEALQAKITALEIVKKQKLKAYHKKVKV